MTCLFSHERDMSVWERCFLVQTVIEQGEFICCNTFSVGSTRSFLFT